MMEFRGDLKDFSIAQLLNLIHLARKTGTLYGNIADKRARLVFADGMLTYARMETGKADLSEILAYNGQIDSSRRRMIREKMETRSEMELGLELVMEGVFTWQAVLDSIRQYSTTVVRQMFTWNEGVFEFRPDEMAPEGKILLNLPLDGLITEGINNLTEQEQLQKEIPDLDVELIFTDQLESAVAQINLNGQEWQVISNVNTHHTLAGIARETKMNEYEVRRAALRLLQTGILQIRTQSDMINPADKTEESRKIGSKIKKLVLQIRHKFGSK